MPKLRHDGEWYKNAAGLYVQGEPIDATLVAAAATNAIPRVKADDTLEFAALIAGANVTITHGASSITIAAASGGGGAPSPDDPPSSPNTEDDEFDSSTLDAKWTETLTGAPTVDIDTSIPSCYVAKLQAGGAARASLLEQSYAPAGDFSVSAKAFGSFSEANDESSLWVLDSGEQEGFVIQWRRGATNLEVLLYTLTSGSLSATATITVGDTHEGDAMYLHFQRIGTTCTGWFSHRGLSFRRLASATKTFTMHHVELRTRMESTATIPYWGGWDWFRRDWRTF